MGRDCAVLMQVPPVGALQARGCGHARRQSMDRRPGLGPIRLCPLGARLGICERHGVERRMLVPLVPLHRGEGCSAGLPAGEGLMALVQGAKGARA